MRTCVMAKGTLIDAQRLPCGYGYVRRAAVGVLMKAPLLIQFCF